MVDTATFQGKENGDCFNEFKKKENMMVSQFQWSGLRENLQETMVCPIKYGVFL